MDHEFWKQFATQDGTEQQLKFDWRCGSLHLLDINLLLRLYWICCSIVICCNEAVDSVSCLPRVLRFSAASNH
jgi:hypothetical protein